MNEFEAIFTSPVATAVFFLISAIGLSGMALIAFGSWTRRVQTPPPARRRRLPHSVAIFTPPRQRAPGRPGA